MFNLIDPYFIFLKFFLTPNLTKPYIVFLHCVLDPHTKMLVKCSPLLIITGTDVDHRSEPWLFYPF